MDPLKGAVDEVLLVDTAIDRIKKELLPMLDGKALRLSTEGSVHFNGNSISGAITIQLVDTTKGNTE